MLRVFEYFIVCKEDGREVITEVGLLYRLINLLKIDHLLNVFISKRLHS